MDPDEYQRFTDTTAIYPRQQESEQIIRAMYCALGLTGESGEVADKIKKWHRDGKIDQKSLVKEIGDVCWYLAQLCDILGYRFSEVLQMNVDKLQSRKDRGVVGGSGDNR